MSKGAPCIARIMSPISRSKIPISRTKKKSLIHFKSPVSAKIIRDLMEKKRNLFAVPVGQHQLGDTIESPIPKNNRTWTISSMILCA